MQRQDVKKKKDKGALWSKKNNGKKFQMADQNEGQNLWGQMFFHCSFIELGCCQFISYKIN